MSHFAPSALCRILACLLFAMPFMATAQPTPATNADSERGWGSEWLKPATPQQAVYRKIDVAEAAQDYRAALALCAQLFSLLPNSPDPYYTRAVVFTQLERYKDALSDLARAEDLAKKRGLRRLCAEIYWVRSKVNLKKRDYAEAVNNLYAAIRFSPNARLSLNALAWLRAVADDPAYRNGAESVKLAQKAITLDGAEPRYTDVDTLAAAYAEAGDFDRAVDAEKRALGLAGKQLKDSVRMKPYETDAKARLQLYEQRQPYHTATW